MHVFCRDVPERLDHNPNLHGYPVIVNLKRQLN